MCLLLWLSSPATAQMPATPDSPLENPFGDQNPGFYQPPDMQVPPGQAQGQPSMGPAIPLQPAPPQCPVPTTLGDLLFADGRNTPRDNRCGAFQKLSFVNTYLPRMGSDGFGLYDAELTSVWGLPCPTKDAPLVITPGFATHWLNGPSNLDIPAQLHDVYTEFRWLPKIGDYFRADVAVQPGYYSDWDGSSIRGVRILGHVSGIYDCTPTFQLVLGAAYLDRPDIEVLPIAGFIWKPDADAEYRVVFPAPKIAWCLLNDWWLMSDPRPAKRNTELWLYLGGELGGGTWAIRHSDGTSDLMSYSDWRVFLGMETKSLVWLGSFIEVGYVFHRTIRLTSIGNDVDFGDTVMARAGVYY